MQSSFFSFLPKWVSALVLGTILGLISTSAQGQVNVQIGARSGITSMTEIGRRVEDLNRRTGVMAGGFVVLDLPGPLALQPELLYVQKGAQWAQPVITGSSGDLRTVDLTITEQFDYIELPLLAKIQIPLGDTFVLPTVFGGPVVGLNVASGRKISGGNWRTAGVEDELQERKPEANQAEFSLVTGVGAEFLISDGPSVVLDIRYELGLTRSVDYRLDYPDSNTIVIPPIIRNQGFVFTAGLAF